MLSLLRPGSPVMSEHVGATLCAEPSCANHIERRVCDECGGRRLTEVEVPASRWALDPYDIATIDCPVCCGEGEVEVEPITEDDLPEEG